MLVVDDLDGQRQALAVLVFGAPAPPPPAVTISPAELVEEGDRVGVDIAGLQPYSIARIGYCNPESRARPWSLPTAATPTPPLSSVRRAAHAASQ